MDQAMSAADAWPGEKPVAAAGPGAKTIVADTALLDPERIEELRGLLGAPRVTQLFDLLSRELHQRPARIRALCHRADVHGARAEAHSLRGAASNLGVVALCDVAAAIESAQSLDEVGRYLPALERLATRTFDAIAGLR